MLTPPYNGWESNLEEAFREGALDAISEVLTRHKGDEGVLDSCVACLRCMASKPAMAGKLVNTPVMADLLEAVLEAPDSPAATAALQLLDTAARTSPSAVLAAGLVPTLTRLLTTTTNPRVKAACVAALERINRVPGGTDALLAAGAAEAAVAFLDAARTDSSIAAAIAEERQRPASQADALGQALSKSMGGGRVAEEEGGVAGALTAAMQLVERLARNPTAAAALTEGSALETLSCALACPVLQDLSAVSKLGGRVIGKLAKGNVASMVSKLEAAAAESTDGESLGAQMGLLANLALEPEVACKVLDQGASINALLSTFNRGAEIASLSADTISAAATAVTRLAAGAASGGERLVQGGLLDTLLAQLNTLREPADALAAVLASLTALLLHSPPSVGAVPFVAGGGAEALVQVLSECGFEPAVYAAGIGLLEVLSVLQPQLLVEGAALAPSAALPAAAAGLMLHTEQEAAQLDALRVCVYLTSTEAAVDVLLAEEGLVQHVHACAADATRPERVPVATYLLASVALTPEGAAAIAQCGGVDAVLPAVASLGVSATTAKAHARDLLGAMVDQGHGSVAGDATDEVARDLATTLQSTGEGARADDSSLAAATVACMKVGLLLDTPSQLTSMVQGGAVAALVSLLTTNAKGSGAGAASMRVAASAALLDTAKSLARHGVLNEETGALDEVATARTATSIMCSLVATLRAGRSVEPDTLTSLGGLRELALMPETAAEALGKGAVEACVAVLRVAGTDADGIQAVTAAAGILGALGAVSPPTGPGTVTSKGGTKQLVAYLVAHAGDATMSEPCTAVARALKVVATGAPPGSAAYKALQSQGAVEGVSTALSAAEDSDPVLAATLRDLLRHLVTEDDLTASLQALQELAPSVATLVAGDDLAALDDLITAVRSVGNLASTSAFAGQLAAGAGGDALSQVMQVANAAHGAGSEEVRRGLLGASLRSLTHLMRGGVSLEEGGVPAADLVGFAQTVLAWEGSTEGKAEALSMLRQVAVADPATASAGIIAASGSGEEGGGSLSTLLCGITEEEVDADMAAAAFHAAADIAAASAAASAVAAQRSGGASDSAQEAAAADALRSAGASAAGTAAALAAAQDEGSVTRLATAAKALCGPEQAAAAVMWLDESAGDATPEAVLGALRFLAVAGRGDGGDAAAVRAAVVERGGLEVLRNALEVHTGRNAPGTQEQQRAIVAAAARLAGAVAGDEATAAAVAEADTVGKVLDKAGSVEGLVGDAAAAAAVVEAVADAARTGALGDGTSASAGSDFVVAALSASGGDAAVAGAGKAALSALGVAGSQVQQLLRNTEGATGDAATAEEGDTAAADALADHVQQLSALLAIDGMLGSTDDPATTTAALDAIAALRAALVQLVRHLGSTSGSPDDELLLRPHAVAVRAAASACVALAKAQPPCLTPVCNALTDGCQRLRESGAHMLSVQARLTAEHLAECLGTLGATGAGVAAVASAGGCDQLVALADELSNSAAARSAGAEGQANAAQGALATMAQVAADDVAAVGRRGSAGSPTGSSEALGKVLVATAQAGPAGQEQFKRLVSAVATSDDAAADEALWKVLGSEVAGVAAAASSSAALHRSGKASSAADRRRGSALATRRGVQQAAASVDPDTTKATLAGLLAQQGLEAGAVAAAQAAMRGGEGDSPITGTSADPPAWSSSPSALAALAATMVAAESTAAAGGGEGDAGSSQGGGEQVLDMCVGMLMSVSQAPGVEEADPPTYFSAPASDAFVNGGGVHVLVAALEQNMDNKAYATHLLKLLRSLAVTGSMAVLRELGQDWAMATLSDTVGLYSTGRGGRGRSDVGVDHAVAGRAADVIGIVSRGLSMDEVHLSERGMQAMVVARRTATAAEAEEAAMFETALEALEGKFDPEALNVVTGMALDLVQAINATAPGTTVDPADLLRDPESQPEGLAVTKTLSPDEGVFFYTDLSTGEAVWEAPTVYGDLAQRVTTLHSTVESMGREVEVVDAGVLATLLAATAKIRRCPELTGPIARTIGALIRDSANMAELVAGADSAAAGELTFTCLTQAQVGYVTLGLLCAAIGSEEGMGGTLFLLTRLASLPSIRAPLVRAGALAMLTAHAWAGVSPADVEGGAEPEPGTWLHCASVVKAGASVLTMLALAGADVPGEFLDAALLQALGGAVLAWRWDAAVLKSLLAAVRNIAAVSSKHSYGVAVHVGPALVALTADASVTDEEQVQNVLTLLAFITKGQHATQFLACGGGGQHLTAACKARAFMEDTSADHAPLLASCFLHVADAESDDPPDGSMDVGAWQPGALRLALAEARAVAALMHLLEEFGSAPDVVMAVCKALASILDDPDVVEAVMAEGVELVQPLLDALRDFEYDESVVTQALSALISVTECDAACLKFVAGGGVAAVVDALESFASSEDPVIFSLAILSMTCEDDAGLAALRARQGLPVILAALRTWTGMARSVVKQSLRVLQRVCFAEDLMRLVGDEGTPLIIKAVERYMDHPRVVERAFKVLALLAKHEQAFQAVVQYGGIDSITAAVSKHPDDVYLLLEAITTLDQLASTSTEACSIVVDEGGEALVRTIMDVHKAEPELQEACESALITMEALKSLGNAAAANLSSEKAEESESELAAKLAALMKRFDAARHALLSGNTMQKWDGKGSKDVVVRASDDFKSIVWLHPKTHARQGALDIVHILDVHAGPGAKHVVEKKGVFGPKPADPACCLWVQAEKRTLFLETTVAPEARRWVDTLKLWMEAYRAMQGKLA